MLQFSAFGAFSMAFSIILGAFGAHWFANMEPDRVTVLMTGVRYQMIHSISLLVLPVLFMKTGLNVGQAIWYLQIAGIVLFSFSLYFLAIRDIIGLSGATWIGAITPFGGLSFILSWIILGIKLVKLA